MIYHDIVYYNPGTCLSSIFGFEPSKRIALSIQNKGHLGHSSHINEHKNPRIPKHYQELVQCGAGSPDFWRLKSTTQVEGFTFK